CGTAELRNSPLTVMSHEAETDSDTDGARACGGRPLTVHSTTPSAGARVVTTRTTALEAGADLFEVSPGRYPLSDGAFFHDQLAFDDASALRVGVEPHGAMKSLLGAHRGTGGRGVFSRGLKRSPVTAGTPLGSFRRMTAERP